jgi:hypothetical protein
MAFIIVTAMKTSNFIYISGAMKVILNMFQVMKALWPFNNKFRVLALSATPGSDMQAVKQVC